MNRTLLVDGDIVVHACVIEAHEEQRTEDDEIHVTLNVPECMANIESRVRTEAKVYGCKNFIMCFGSKNNFRKKLDPSYKSNRANKGKPLGYYAIVGECVDKLNGVKIPNLEADDVIGLLATNPEYVNGYRVIVCSTDKDMQTLPVRLVNPSKPELGITKISKREAAEFWMVQTLAGDQSDGYKGCPGIGEKKARDGLSEFSEIKNSKQFIKAAWNEFVVPKFKAQGLSRDDALLSARLARILRDDDYDFDRGKVKLWVPPDDVAASQLSKRRIRKRRERVRRRTRRMVD